MDRKTKNLIQKALRSTTRKWKMRNDVIDDCKISVPIGRFGNGKTKYKTLFVCAKCHRQLAPIAVPERKTKKGKVIKATIKCPVQVDHIEEVGDLKFTETDGLLKCNWTEYIERLYCDRDNLQALCEDCHGRKTALFNSAKKTKRDP